MKRNQRLKGNGETVSCVIEKWEARKLKRLAEKKGMSVSATLRAMILAGVAQSESKNTKYKSPLDE